MLLADLATTSKAVASTSSRKAKVEALATCLSTAAEAGRLDAELAAGYLIGQPRQGRIGVGWATIANADVAAVATATLTLIDLDSCLTALAETIGAGSQQRRIQLLTELLGTATVEEQELVRRILLGDPAQGALEGVLVSAIGAAASIPITRIRRATMLIGDVATVAGAALIGGAGELDQIGLRVLRPVKPMLASTAGSPAEAMDGTDGWSVEWKLDGARIQVHRLGDDVRIYTRNLNDVTERMPTVVDLVRALPVSAVILDGESIGVDADGSPDAFQDTMSRFGSDGATSRLAPRFFDVLHIDGRDLLDEPLTERRRVLDQILPAHAVIPAVATTDPAAADEMLTSALANGHEGIMLKRVDSLYDAGRRGKGWLKVKPVHTLDLVVLAVEWGHGRRHGWLSNLHLGARLNDNDPGFVMLGKTFKGLTDELLVWQTERFLELETGRSGHIVHVQPVQVVEIAVDGIQNSSRYPGGVALRFARVKRYRTDKSAADADTLEAVKALG